MRFEGKLFNLFIISVLTIGFLVSGRGKLVLAGPCLHSINNLGQVYDCCNNGDAASKTYNPSNGYCSRTCGGGTCYYDVGSGNWQPTSCNNQSCTPTPISSPIPTPTPINTPTTTNPTPPPSLCFFQPYGDANCDGIINSSDFDIWNQEFTAVGSTKQSNFFNDNVVDLIDFEIWRRYAAGAPIPTPTVTPIVPTPTPTDTPIPTPTGPLCCFQSQLDTGFQCFQDCGPPVAQPGDTVVGYSCLSPSQVALRTEFGCPINPN